MLALLGHRIQFTTSYREGMTQPDVVFIAVNTPRNSDGSPDLSFLQKAVEGIRSHLANEGSPVLLVVKSTVPVGTADNLQQEFLCSWGRQVRVISSPEFLREGCALFDTFYPARMVFGRDREACNILTKALQGEPLTVYGDGMQTRSFCYIDDLVEGLYRLLLWVPGARPQVSGVGSQHPGHEQLEPASQHLTIDTQDLTPVFNLGSPVEVRILELAKEIIALTDSRSEIVFEPLPQDDPKVRRPDITKARTLLGWEPRIKRREGLLAVIPYFRECLRAPLPEGRRR